jgi:hypothetical protein
MRPFGFIASKIGEYLARIARIQGGARRRDHCFREHDLADHDQSRTLITILGNPQTALSVTSRLAIVLGSSAKSVIVGKGHSI